MKFKVQNLVLVELGPEFVGEADFQEHRISVRCTYDADHWCWVCNVFLVEEVPQRRLSGTPSRLRASSRLGAVHLGMKFAVSEILGLGQDHSTMDSEFQPMPED